MEQTTKEVVLTYETLYEILRKEKSREELQQLDEHFLADALNYFREKQQAYDDNLTKNDIFSQSERDRLDSGWMRRESARTRASRLCRRDDFITSWEGGLGRSHRVGLVQFIRLLCSPDWSTRLTSGWNC